MFIVTEPLAPTANRTAIVVGFAPLVVVNEQVLFTVSVPLPSRVAAVPVPCDVIVTGPFAFTVVFSVSVALCGETVPVSTFREPVLVIVVGMANVPFEPTIYGLPTFSAPLVVNEPLPSNWPAKLRVPENNKATF